MIKNAGIIMVSGEYYFIQVRQVSRYEFEDGKYPFTWPGALSLFGGGLEEDETLEQGCRREVKEELGIVLPEKLELKVYDWKKDIDETIERINSTFQGNLPSFLGFDLKDKIPDCALGKFRDKGKPTFREFLSERIEAFYTAKLDKKIDYIVNEGEKGIWLPHYVLRSNVMYPGDKLVVLDDISKRIKSGEYKL